MEEQWAIFCTWGILVLLENNLKTAVGGARSIGGLVFITSLTVKDHAWECVSKMASFVNDADQFFCSVPA